MGEHKPITYGRAWETSDEMIPGRAAYVPPQTLPPVLRATRIVLHVDRRKPTKANPLGSVKDVQFLWPQSVLDARGGQEPDIPPGAKVLIKALLATAREPEVIVSYARGYDINASGENVRKPIWSVRERGPEDGTPKPRKDGKAPSTVIRTQIGEEDPQPVDSVTVAGVWRDQAARPLAFVEGWWLDASPQRSRIWTRDGAPEQIGWTPFMARVKELAAQFAAEQGGLW